uniref:Low density lipoprotein receptor class A domain containing 2 n=1 Tax=Eptatretus burgeri TaxID=7764 RepID=A0A8C4QY54_EPTBU
MTITEERKTDKTETGTSTMCASLLFFLVCAVLAINVRWVLSIDQGNLVDLCGRTLTVDGLTLRSHRESKKYYFVGLDADCWLSVRASSSGERLAFTFRYFLVYSLIRVAAFPEPTVETHSAVPLVAGPDPCHAGSFIQFYDGDGPLVAPLGPPLCGKTIPEPVKSSGIALTLQLVTRGKLPRVDFIGDFTSFTLDTNGSICGPDPCLSRYFRCRNGRCIPWSLVCDAQRVDNCGDGSDQSLFFPDDTCPGWFAPRPTEPHYPGATFSPPDCVQLRAPADPAWSALPHPHGPSRESVPVTTTAGSSPKAVSTPLMFVLGALCGAAVLLLFMWCCGSPAWCVWRLSAVCAARWSGCTRCTRKAVVGRVQPHGTIAS